MKHRLWILLILTQTSLAANTVPLEEAVEAALSRNPSLQATRHRMVAARGAARQARAAYYPHLSAVGEYSLTDNPVQAFMMSLNQGGLNISDPALNVNAPGDTDNLRVGALVRYSVYDGGHRSANRRRADHGSEAAAHASNAACNELVYQITEAYLRALQARDAITVRVTALESMEEHLRVAEQRLEEGAALITDVLNLKVQVAQAREDRITSQHGLELAISSLNTRIGTPLISADNLSEPPDHLPDLVPLDADLSETHSELQALRALRNVRIAEIQAARSTGRPAVHAFGLMDWNQEPFDNAEQSYMVGVAAQWQIFDGFQRRGAIDEAQAREHELRQQILDTENRLRHRQTQAHIQARNAKERWEAANVNERSAERALRATRDRYKEGAATLSDLLTAQAGLTAIQHRKSVAYYEYLIAQAAIARAQGTLVIDHEEGKRL